ncbi:MAG: hypothetical protein PVG72_03715, partial [Gammaproteobacteria bacterium]
TWHRSGVPSVLPESADPGGLQSQRDRSRVNSGVYPLLDARGLAAQLRNCFLVTDNVFYRAGTSVPVPVFFAKTFNRKRNGIFAAEIAG